LIAGLLGIALLGDSFRPIGVVGMVVVAVGLITLAGRAVAAEVVVALAVAATIGVYSVIDAKGIRSIDTPLYAAASFVCVTTASSTYALATGRGAEMVSAMRAYWRRFATMGIASGVTYALVQIAFERAPVGYVTCLRESSVLIAAFVGARYLGEGQAARRLAAAGVVVVGLLLLVIGR
jgi:drug/metabolite transporter (DMT)-like permease